MNVGDQMVEVTDTTGGSDTMHLLNGEDNVHGD